VENFLKVLEEMVKEGKEKVSLQEVWIRYRRKFGELSWREFKFMAKRAEEEGYWVREGVIIKFIREKF